MIDTGIVTGREITINKDGEEDVEMLQVQMTDDEDIQSVQLMIQAGDDSPPPEDSLVTIVSIAEAYQIAVAVEDNISPTMLPGEKKLYSSAAGVIKAFINMLSDGTIEINGNTDFAVAFDDLKAGFDLLRGELNAFIAVFDAHDHTTSVGPPTTQGVTAVASIDASKILTIKVP